jgi:Mg2+/citrate symporter
MTLLIIQAVLLGVAHIAFSDWRKQRKSWQLLCSIYMVLSAVVIGAVGTALGGDI